MAERVEKLTLEIGGRNRSAGMFAEVERGLDRIKARLGPRGFLKDLTELAVGGGAVAGLNFFTNTIANGAEKMRDLFDEVRSGKKDVGDVVSETARMLPVLGGAVRFWDAIRESVTGARAEIEKINAEAAANDAKTKRMKTRLDALNTINPNITGADAEEQVTKLLGGQTEMQFMARLATARLLAKQGKPIGPPAATRIDTNGNVVPAAPVRIDTNGNRVSLSQEEINGPISLQEREKTLDAIRKLRANVVGRSVLEPVLKGLQGLITPQVIKGYEDSKSPSIFGFKLPFIGSAAARRRPVDANANSFQFPFLPPDQQDKLLPFILGGEKGLAEQRRAAMGKALSLAESELSSLQNGRVGGSVFASSDTRRGITGVRSLGNTIDGPSEREKALIQAIKDLKKELEKPDPLLQEAVELLKSYRVFLDPKSEL